jgi:hypothetical protein
MALIPARRLIGTNVFQAKRTLAMRKAIAMAQPKLTKQFSRVEKGQIWKLGETYLQITDAGKRLIHYIGLSTWLLFDSGTPMRCALLGRRDTIGGVVVAKWTGRSLQFSEKSETARVADTLSLHRGRAGLPPVQSSRVVAQQWI